MIRVSERVRLCERETERERLRGRHIDIVKDPTDNGQRARQRLMWRKI